MTNSGSNKDNSSSNSNQEEEKDSTSNGNGLSGLTAQIAGRFLDIFDHDGNGKKHTLFGNFSVVVMSTRISHAVFVSF